MADPNSPFQPMDMATLMQGFQGGNLPGKTAAAKLNFLQDMMSTTGNPFKSDPAVAQVQADPSLNRSIYNSNPVIKSGMDLIDQNTDPVSAFEAVKKANPTDASGADIWTDPTTGKPSQNATDVQKVLHDYAFEMKQNALDASKANRKNAKPPGIMDVSNAYDLSAQPTVDDLLNQMVANKQLARGPQGHGGGPTPDVTPLDYATWAKQQGGSAAKPGPNSSANEHKGMNGTTMPVDPKAPLNRADFYLAPSQAQQYVNAGAGAVNAVKGTVGKVVGNMGGVGGSSTNLAAYAKYVADTKAKGAAAAAAAPQYINGSMMDNNNARIAANNWIRNAKATTIHSDAYNKAVQSIVALRSMMGS